MAGRPYVFSSPNDVTPANPKTVMTSEQIIGLYNQAHPGEAPMQRMTDKVKNWVVDEAKNKYNWDAAHIADNYCILERHDLAIR